MFGTGTRRSSANYLSRRTVCMAPTTNLAIDLASIHRRSVDRGLAQGASRVQDWHGEGADAFRQEIGKARADIDATGAHAIGVSKAIRTAEIWVSGCRASINDIDEEARGLGWTVTPDWQIDTSQNPPIGADGLEIEQAALQIRLSELQQQAEIADHDLAVAIKAAAGDAQGTPDGHEVHDQPQAPPPADGFHPLTADQLRQIVPGLSAERAAQIVGPLNDAMKQGGMNTPQRQAAFISQVAEESDRFKTFEEYADGSEYNGNTDLGNTQPGDGSRFKGRGAIQVTGRNNYTKMSHDLGVDFVNHPELAAEPQWAFKTALWYWDTHGGNAVADRGDIVEITKMVNGGIHGLDVRTQFYNNALQALSR